MTDTETHRKTEKGLEVRVGLPSGCDVREEASNYDEKDRTAIINYIQEAHDKIREMMRRKKRTLGKDYSASEFELTFTEYKK